MQYAYFICGNETIQDETISQSVYTLYSRPFPAACIPAAPTLTDQAEIARLGNVTRARVTQIMNLLHLAPDIQEALLFLPLTIKGRDPIREKHLRPIAAEPDWRKRRRLWKGWAVDHPTHDS